MRTLPSFQFLQTDSHLATKSLSRLEKSWWGIILTTVTLAAPGCAIESESREVAQEQNFECVEAGDCEDLYPGLNIAACNPSNSACRCWDADQNKVRCDELEVVSPAAPRKVRLESVGHGLWLQAQGISDGSSGACGDSAASNVRGADPGFSGDFTRWILEPVGDHFKIVSVGNGKALQSTNLPDAGLNSKNAVRLVNSDACNDGSILWNKRPSASDTFFLDNVLHGNRLQLSNSPDVDSNEGQQLRAGATSLDGSWVSFRTIDAEPDQQPSPPIDPTPPGNEVQVLVRSIPVAQAGRYPAGVVASSKYRVMVKLASDSTAWDSSRHMTAVYDAWPDYDDVPGELQNNHVHLTQFDASKQVRVRVELLQGSLNRVKLKPARYGLGAGQQVGPTWVEFSVTPGSLTKHILVEANDPNDGKVLNHGLMIFVNPLLEMPEGNVLSLPSGVIDSSSSLMDSNHRIFIPANSQYDAIYIPQDTIVNGRIHIKKPNFKVVGRGMVVGSRFTWAKADPNWQNRYPITPDGERVKGIVESNANNTVFDGITIVHPYHFNFVGGNLTRNVKAFGWRHSSDGIHGVDRVEGAFTRVNDDHVYFPTREIVDSSFWGLTNGSIFQGGWGGSGSNGGLRSGGFVKRCNVLRGEWNGDGGERQNNGIFGSVDFSTNDVDGYLFEDVDVEGKQCRMLNFSMACNGRCNRGSWRNITFKDITFEYSLGCPDSSKHLDNFLTTDGELKNITFDNVYFGATRLSGWSDLAPVQRTNVTSARFF